MMIFPLSIIDSDSIIAIFFRIVVAVRMIILCDVAVVEVAAIVVCGDDVLELIA